MGKGHQFELCRSLYASARADGCPKILVQKLSRDYYLVETVDGTMSRQMGSQCCKWAAKYDLAVEWIARRDEKAELAGRESVNE